MNYSTMDTPVAKAERTISSLQLGMSWFPEQAGNGLDRMYYALMRHLPGAGVHVRGLVAGTPEVGLDTDIPVRAFAREDASLPTRLLNLRRHVRQAMHYKSFDLVASHFALYTMPALDVLGDVPLVVHFHGPWAGESQVEGASSLAVRAKAFLEQTVYKRGARFIVLSEAFKSVLQSTYGVDDDQIRIVPGGVDVDRFDTGLSRAEARERLGWPQDRPILLSVRRLARRMGLENLIDAMQTVRAQVPDVLLHIAGKGPIADELQARIDAAGLHDHVQLLGFVPDADLPLAYRAADCSIVPTVALEGFGLITIESLAAGTPVLVTPVGGLPETVRGLSTNLVLPGTETDELSQYLLDVLQGHIDIPSAEACQTYARNHFDWPIIARQTRAVYKSVL